MSKRQTKTEDTNEDATQVAHKKRGPKTFNTEIYKLFKMLKNREGYAITEASKELLSNSVEYFLVTVSKQILLLRSSSVGKRVNKTVTKNKVETTVSVRKNSSVLLKRMVRAAVMSIFTTDYFNEIDRYVEKQISLYSDKDKKNKKSKQETSELKRKIGLTFNFAHIADILKKNITFRRLSSDAISYLTFTVNFIFTEIIRAGIESAERKNDAKNSEKGQRIKSHHFSNAIKNNNNLRIAFGNCIFGEGSSVRSQKLHLLKIGFDANKVNEMFPDPKPRAARKATSKSPGRKTSKSPGRKAAKKPAKKPAVKKERAVKPAAKKQAAGKGRGRKTTKKE